MSSSTMEAASAVEPAAKARTTGSGKSSGFTTVTKATERSGMSAHGVVRRTKSMPDVRASISTTDSVIMEALAPVPKIRLAIVEAASAAIERIVVEKSSAVGFKAVVVKNNIVMMPVRSPVVPSPAKAAKEANAKA